MADKVYLWGAPLISQVDTISITGFDAATTYRVTFNNKTVEVLGTTDANTTAAALQALLALSNTPPEFQECTWAVSTSNITATANTPGKPFTLSVSVSGGAGTISRTATTANSGPSDISVTSNWSGNALPASGDSIYFQESNQDLLWNLDALSAIVPLAVYWEATFTGKVGLLEINTDNPSLPYGEYRTKYLVFSPATGGTTATYNAGRGATAQSQGLTRLKLNTGTTANATATIFNILSTGTPADQQIGLEAILWKGLVAGTGTNTVNISKGTLGIAVLPGETATVNAMRITYQQSRDSDVQVRCGSGVSFPASSTIDKAGGELQINSATVDLLNDGGNTTLRGTAAHTLINLEAGRVYYETNGTLTTVNVGTGADLDLSRDIRPRTITTCNVYPDGGVFDPFNTGTWTNGVRLQHCRIGEVRLDLGTHVQLVPTAL